MGEAPVQSQPKIIAWLKPHCGWSRGVRAVFQKYGLAYEDRDIINNPMHFGEMVKLTGQTRQPCVQVDGQMLVDVSGEEVEAWLIAHGYVTPSEEDPGVPLNEACAPELHAERA
jgi:glutaredoxin